MRHLVECFQTLENSSKRGMFEDLTHNESLVTQLISQAWASQLERFQNKTGFILFYHKGTKNIIMNLLSACYLAG